MISRARVVLRFASRLLARLVPKWPPSSNSASRIWGFSRRYEASLAERRYAACVRVPVERDHGFRRKVIIQSGGR